MATNAITDAAIIMAAYLLVIRSETAQVVISIAIAAFSLDLAPMEDVSRDLESGDCPEHLQPGVDKARLPIVTCRHRTAGHDRRGCDPR